MSGFDGGSDVIMSSENDSGLHRNTEFEASLALLHNSLVGRFDQLATNLPQLISEAVARGVHHARSEAGPVR
jgi:hypothetical protein